MKRGDTKPEGRRLPAALAAERSVLGSVLIAQSDGLLARVRALLRPEEFSLDSHRCIFTRMLQIAERKQPVDLISLCEEMRRTGELERVGGAAYLSDLTTGVVPASAEYHVKIIRERAALRGLALLGEQLTAKAQAQDADARVLASWAQEKLAPLRRLDPMPAANGAKVDAATLLSELARFVRQFVVVSPAQADVTALWIVHTHAFEAAEATPYLNIGSAEKQSGKTRLLEVLELLVNKPWFTCSATASVLKRKIDEESPTLLLDESDAAFKGEKEYAEALRGVLNAGHRRGGVASMSVVQGANITFKDFKVFCPKALAGLGTLPDTVADRTIPIRLKRKAAHESVQRFRRREVEEQARTLRERLALWTASQLKGLHDARPGLPEELSDRQQDGAEPLLAISDLVGGEWPERARKALGEVFAMPAAEDESLSVRLLADIRAIFDAKGADRLASADLAATLAELESSPWPELKKGKPITPTSLARLLRKHEIGPRNIRDGENVCKGYERSAFEDAWGRYLPSAPPVPGREPLPTLQRSVDAGDLAFSEPLQGPGAAAAKSKESPTTAGPVAVVAARCYIHGRGAEWWRRAEGDLVCGVCHPPTEEVLPAGLQDRHQT